MGHFTQLSLSSALLALAFTAEPAHAGKIVHVDQLHPSASDAGPGSYTAPFRTIQEALDANPDAGVTFVVHSGIYRERVVVPTSATATAPVVLRAEGRGAVVRAPWRDHLVRSPGRRRGSASCVSARTSEPG